MTARAGTEEEAANLALAAAKQPPIALLTDNNDRARAVSAVFAAARDATLRQKDWNFATGWMVLTQVAGLEHPSDLEKIYPLPADCLRVRKVQDAGVDDWETVSYKNSADSDAEVPVLITNLTAPLVCYTRRIEAVRLWDPDFLLAFSFRCAELAGPQLGLSTTRIDALAAKANEWRDEAATTDAQEAAPRQMTRSTSWTRARAIGGGGRGSN